MTEIELLKTPDSNLASVLYCLGFGILGIHPKGRGDTMEFYFEKSDSLQKAVSEYMMRSLRMEPRELLDSRREIIAKVKEEYEKSLRKS